MKLDYDFDTDKYEITDIKLLTADLISMHRKVLRMKVEEGF